MPRDALTVLDQVWASDPNAEVENPTVAGLDFTVGWPGYFSDGTLNPEREHVNWFMRLLTAITKELNRRGMLEMAQRRELHTSRLYSGF